MEAAAVLLRDLVNERTGIYVDDRNLDIFMERLSSLILQRGLETPLDYYYLLKYDAEAESEWPRLIDTISVRETFFWREFEQIRALVEHILPLHFSKPGAGIFRIWSAACASGEEPLTIAMAINEAELWKYPIEIVASDASSAALRIARTGVYRERSFRILAPHLQARYFTACDNGWKMDRDIHRRVSWHKANLTVGEEIAPLAASNVIFCRNVFIYFKPETIKKVVESFARYMKCPACLFVGAPESLLKLTTRFELKEIGAAFAYMRVRGED